MRALRHTRHRFHFRIRYTSATPREATYRKPNYGPGILAAGTGARLDKVM